jgi:predicted Zn-dependent peptidase
LGCRFPGAIKLSAAHATASDVILENGLRLIVQTDSTSPTVLVRGSVKHTVESQSGVDDDAVAGILKGLYEDGTQNMDRLTFDKVLDEAKSLVPALPD